MSEMSASYEFYLIRASQLFYIGLKSTIGVILSSILRLDITRETDNFDHWNYGSLSPSVLRRDAVRTMGNTLGTFVEDSWDY